MIFTQNEIIIMIGVVSILLFCITVLTILDIKEYLKIKKSSVSEEVPFGKEYSEEEKNPTDEVVLMEEEKEQEVLVNDTSLNVDNPNKEIFFEEMEDEKFNIDDNIKLEITEDTPKVLEEKVETVSTVIQKEEEKNIELFEELDEMDENLPIKKNDVTNFEAEQERTAIISLDELMQKSNELYDDNEIVQYDDGNEPITIDEVISRFRHENESMKNEKIETSVVLKETLDEKKIEPYSKKETIPFISSVYGIEKQNNALEFENTASYEKLDRQNYSDFVAKLREMNENK